MHSSGRLAQPNTFKRRRRAPNGPKSVAPRAAMAMNLLLIGYRGSGKSAVARRVALCLGWDWVDADVELELRAGKSIRALFELQGEQAFRDLESQVLIDLSRCERSVLALG